MPWQFLGSILDVLREQRAWCGAVHTRARYDNYLVGTNCKLSNIARSSKAILTLNSTAPHTT